MDLRTKRRIARALNSGIRLATKYSVTKIVEALPKEEIKALSKKR